jgi:hypothetical protein
MTINIKYLVQVDHNENLENFYLFGGEKCAKEFMEKELKLIPSEIEASLWHNEDNVSGLVTAQLIPLEEK